MNNFFDTINLKSGILSYNDFDIDPNLSFKEQRLSFKEDIIQIIFEQIYTIDVGWYPEFEVDGHFKIRAIKDFNWYNPIFKKTCKDVETLKKHLQKAIDFTDQLYCAKRN